LFKTVTHFGNAVSRLVDSTEIDRTFLALRIDYPMASTRAKIDVANNVFWQLVAGAYFEILIRT
jgi:hypothetical protein